MQFKMSDCPNKVRPSRVGNWPKGPNYLLSCLRTGTPHFHVDSIQVQIRFWTICHLHTNYRGRVASRLTPVTMLLNPSTARTGLGFVALLLVTCAYMATTVSNILRILPLDKPPYLKEITPEPIDICFVSSIFAPTIKTADRPNDFSSFQMENTTSFQFFLYTNLEDLESLGWTKVLRNFNYRRFITQSRWGKFMAWKDPEMKACRTIFYFDGHFKPDRSPRRFADLAKQIRGSEFGLAQRPHTSKPSAIGEFDAILRFKKDITKNVNASIEWLQAQPDFYNNCTMYENTFFGKSIVEHTVCVLLFMRCRASAYPTTSICLHAGYDPTNVHFQRAAEYFWNHYSKEEDSWRDQPLWCHTIERSHIKPILIGKIFIPSLRRMGHQFHQYSAVQDNDAAASASAASIS
jgi:hypothetical protein